MSSISVHTEAASRPKVISVLDKTTALKIAFFGIFGVHNLGNECTLQAILHNARKWLPSAELSSISYDPDDTTLRHGVKAVPVNGSTARNPGVARSAGIGRWRRILFHRVPGELRELRRAKQALKDFDLVVMTGTGMLTDYMTTAAGFPYDVFKWSVAARLAGCKLRFVGVGVGPIYGRVSRWLIKRALSLADFRSFRDENSRNRVRKIGFNSDTDAVFPDLAFSLPPAIFPRKQSRRSAKPVLGLGIMDHRDIHIATREEQEAGYAAYLEKMCEFVCWLVMNGYTVRILQGDFKYDRAPRADLKAKLEGRGVRYEEAGIIDEDTTTVEELLRQLADCDFIVSPRFHNLVLGLMLTKPVISISYDPKSDALLQAFGLDRYRQALTELDVKKLMDQLISLKANEERIKPTIAEVTARNQRLLAEQYEVIFGKF